MELDQGNILSCGKAVLEKEAEALQRLSAGLDQSFVRAVALLLECRGMVLVFGVGKSGNIGEKIAATLSSLGTPALFVHAIEAAHGGLGVIRPEDILVLISYSGETDEILNLLPHLAQHGCATIAFTGNASSTLARAVTLHLDIGVRTEADPLGLAPTASSTATLALGDALAVALAVARGFTREDFQRYHPGGSLGRRLFGRDSTS